MYYKEMDDVEAVLDSQIEQLPDGHLKTQEDVENFVNENLAQELPLDKP